MRVCKIVCIFSGQCEIEAIELCNFVLYVQKKMLIAFNVMCVITVSDLLMVMSSTKERIPETKERDERGEEGRERENFAPCQSTAKQSNKNYVTDDFCIGRKIIQTKHYTRHNQLRFPSSHGLILQELFSLLIRIAHKYTYQKKSSKKNVCVCV